MDALALRTDRVVRRHVGRPSSGLNSKRHAVCDGHGHDIGEMLRLMKTPHGFPMFSLAIEVSGALFDKERSHGDTNIAR